MRKLIIIVALAFVANLTLSAQTKVSAGYTNDSFVYTLTSVGVKTNIKGNGMFVMGTYDISITDNFAVTPGVRLDYVATTNKNQYTTQKGTNIYVGIPVFVSTKKSIGSELELGAGLGPTLNFGVVANDEILVNNVSTGVFDNYKNGELSRVDVLVGAQVFLQAFSTFRVTVGYDMGTVNTSKLDNTIRKLRRLNVGLTYSF